jgi:hypothetical protein
MSQSMPGGGPPVTGGRTTSRGGVWFQQVA